MPRPARREILDRLVGEGRLDREDADSIARAPGLAFSTPELVGYLAGLIVVVGLIRLLAAAEASPSAIAIMLLVTGYVSAISTRRITLDSTARQRLIEVIEVASVTQFAIAVGILFDQHVLESPELSVAVIATVTRSPTVRASRPSRSRSTARAPRTRSRSPPRSTKSWRTCAAR